MTSRDFAYWLQGFFELTNAEIIIKHQTDTIKKHLNLVFKHEIDPSMGDMAHQKALNKIHHTAYQFPSTEEEAIKIFGAKPSQEHEFNLHGWYDPKEGVPRC